MGVFDIHFKDVTNDPIAATRIGPNQEARYQELRDELLNLGFSQVGLLRSVRQVSAMQRGLAALRRLDRPPGVEPHGPAMQEGQIAEVLNSPGREAFAMVDSSSDDPVIVLQTILQNGAIVDTTMNPVRLQDLPRVSSPVEKGESRKTIAAGLNGLCDAIMNLFLGSFPRWSREDCPEAGYYLELVEGPSVQLLWERHRSRIQQEQQSGIGPHDDLDLFVCISRRWDHIRDAKAVWDTSFSCALWALGVLVLAVCFAGVSAAMRIPWVALFLLEYIVGALLILLVRTVMKRSAARWPGTRLQSVAELLKRYGLRANGY